MTEAIRIAVTDGRNVSALFLSPAQPRHILALAHGAGAGMRHLFMENLAQELASARIATLRYQFPYLEEKRRVPDSPALLTATVAAAVRTALQLAPNLPLFAGGKSMGGRMTSQAAAQGQLPDVRGLVFFGFPLHPPGSPGTKRAEHLARVTVPMLFLQGTRDTFADLHLLRPVCAQLGARATLHIIATADHSFHVLKSAKRDDADVLRKLAETTAAWMESVS
jgi:predicted alpha/beta-hydrolase family hydrolase